MTEEIEATEEKKSVKMSKMPKMNIWMITSIILVIILIGVLVYFGTGISGMTVADSDNSLKPEEAALKAIKFINENLVQPGTEASFVSVADFEGIYNVTVSYQDNDISVFVTKDGTNMFLSAPLDITTPLPQAEETQEEQQSEEILKTDKPEVHAFVMSYCPYGLQFMKAYIPVIELLGDKADLELNFVHYAMHGKSEIDENTRMYCIQKEQNDKFTKYLRCFVESDDYEKCISEAGIDKTKLESCISSTDEQFNITGLYNDKSTWSGGSYPMYPVDAVLAQQFGVGGSPTFVVNGKTLSVQRSPEAIKQAICEAFITPPSECEQTLSTTVESAGIGPMGSGTGSTSSGTC
jgi:protein-disulfide isomerase